MHFWYTTFGKKRLDALYFASKLFFFFVVVVVVESKNQFVRLFFLWIVYFSCHL